MVPKSADSCTPVALSRRMVVPSGDTCTPRHVPVESAPEPITLRAYGETDQITVQVKNHGRPIPEPDPLQDPAPLPARA